METAFSPKSTLSNTAIVLHVRGPSQLSILSVVGPMRSMH